MLLSLVMTLIVQLEMACSGPSRYIILDEYGIGTTILYPGGRIKVTCDGGIIVLNFLIKTEKMLLDKHRIGNHYELYCLDKYNKTYGVKLVFPGILIDRVKRGNEECENNKGKPCNSGKQLIAKNRLCLQGESTPETAKTECDVYKSYTAEDGASMGTQNSIAFFLPHKSFPTKCETSYVFWLDGKKSINPASIIHKPADQNSKIVVHWYHVTDKYDEIKATDLQCVMTLLGGRTISTQISKKVNIYVKDIEPDGELARVDCLVQNMAASTYFFVGRDMNITCAETIWVKSISGVWHTITKHATCGVPKWMKQGKTEVEPKIVKGALHGKYTLECKVTVKYCYTNRPETITTKKECSHKISTFPLSQRPAPTPTQSGPVTTSTVHASPYMTTPPGATLPRTTSSTISSTILPALLAKVQGNNLALYIAIIGSFFAGCFTGFISKLDQPLSKVRRHRRKVVPNDSNKNNESKEADSISVKHELEQSDSDQGTSDQDSDKTAEDDSTDCS